ncbi:hypothetical protein G210_4740 [Candida maltosa Xu316]|uniref:Uncharacterized protein n=1 Tax=Candida maltosa (strain Xu316) TaxID=1245528 RepID=M3K617_CANMX|nr:hypothetical protein G210_4740 [Candida maltosa Xu316]
MAKFLDLPDHVIERLAIEAGIHRIPKEILRDVVRCFRTNNYCKFICAQIWDTSKLDFLDVVYIDGITTAIDRERRIIDKNKFLDMVKSMSMHDYRTSYLSRLVRVWKGNPMFKLFLSHEHSTISTIDTVSNSKFHPWVIVKSETFNYGSINDSINLFTVGYLQTQEIRNIQIVDMDISDQFIAPRFVTKIKPKQLTIRIDSTKPVVSLAMIEKIIDPSNIEKFSVSYARWETTVTIDDFFTEEFIKLKEFNIEVGYFTRKYGYFTNGDFPCLKKLNIVLYGCTKLNSDQNYEEEFMTYMKKRYKLKQFKIEVNRRFI